MRVLIISPQSYNGLQLSKQHYARALYSLGHEVYFLEPPRQWEIGTNKISLEHSDGIGVVKSNLTLPSRIYGIHNRIKRWVMKGWMRAVIDKVGEPDLIWCFDNYGNRLTNLSNYFNCKKILHVVDNSPSMISSDMGADLVVGVSDSILSKIMTNKPKSHVSHALNPVFLKQANEEYIAGADIRVGYFGNLSFYAIDYKLFNECIENIKDVEWHFWGPLSSQHLADNEYKLFVNHLHNTDNVHFHGLKTPKDLLSDIKRIGVSHFISLYKSEVVESRGGNSHKLLEYLSFGIPVISNHISSYSELDLLLMPDSIMGVWTVKDVDRLLKNSDINNGESQREYASRFSYKGNTEQILSEIEGI